MHLMQPAPQAPRTRANGQDTERTGARCPTKRSAQCEHRPSHQTQYPRFHELIHALGVGYGQYGREVAEVLTETAAFVACRSLGLDTSGMAVPYVASWGASDDLDAIRTYADIVDTMARQIEEACA